MAAQGTKRSLQYDGQEVPKSKKPRLPLTSTQVQDTKGAVSNNVPAKFCAKCGVACAGGGAVGGATRCGMCDSWYCAQHYAEHPHAELRPVTDRFSCGCPARWGNVGDIAWRESDPFEFIPDSTHDCKKRVRCGSCKIDLCPLPDPRFSSGKGSCSDISPCSAFFCGGAFCPEHWKSEHHDCKAACTECHKVITLATGGYCGECDHRYCNEHMDDHHECREVPGTPQHRSPLDDPVLDLDAPGTPTIHPVVPGALGSLLDRTNRADQALARGIALPAAVGAPPVPAEQPLPMDDNDDNAEERLMDEMDGYGPEIGTADKGKVRGAIRLLTDPNRQTLPSAQELKNLHDSLQNPLAAVQGLGAALALEAKMHTLAQSTLNTTKAHHEIAKKRLAKAEAERKAFETGLDQSQRDHAATRGKLKELVAQAEEDHKTLKTALTQLYDADRTNRDRTQELLANSERLKHECEQARGTIERQARELRASAEQKRALICAVGHPEMDITALYGVREASTVKDSDFIITHGEKFDNEGRGRGVLWLGMVSKVINAAKGRVVLSHYYDADPATGLMLRHDESRPAGRLATKGEVLRFVCIDRPPLHVNDWRRLKARVAQGEPFVHFGIDLE